MEQVFMFSAPLLTVNNAISKGRVLAGITNGFVSVPIPPYCPLVPPLPLYLTHWSSVLYLFFFKLIVWFGLFFFVVFTSAVEKKNNVRKFKYLKTFQGKKKGVLLLF